jgi:glycosyltransferase involved in cell wall biosynthesis
VLGGNIPEFAGYPRELPVMHTDPDNIYQNLKMLLETPELRRELGEKGRRYVEKYHDHRKIADDFIRLLTGSKGK